VAISLRLRYLALAVSKQCLAIDKNEPCGAMRDRWNCIDRRYTVQNNSWRIEESCALMFKADFYGTGKRI
jgi:hypothetical protein